jgi:DNA-binding transcriptional MerR regulator
MTHLYVKALARVAGVSSGAVRHYGRVGLLTPKRDPNNGYDVFEASDTARLRFIRRAKYLGYTLKEMQQIFQESNNGQSPCPLAWKIIERRAF